MPVVTLWSSPLVLAHRCIQVWSVVLLPLNAHLLFQLLDCLLVFVLVHILRVVLRHLLVKQSSIAKNAVDDVVNLVLGLVDTAQLLELTFGIGVHTHNIACGFELFELVVHALERTHLVKRVASWFAI